MCMRNKTQHQQAGSASSDAREERSKKADVGEASEQTTQGSPEIKNKPQQKKSTTAPKAGPVPGRVTK